MIEKNDLDLRNTLQYIHRTPKSFFCAYKFSSFPRWVYILSKVMTG